LVTRASIRSTIVRPAANFVPGVTPLLQGTARILCGDLDGGDAFFADALSLEEERGAPDIIALTLCERSLVAMARDQWNQAGALASRAAAHLSQGGVEDSYAAALTSAVQARAALHRGDVPASVYGFTGAVAGPVFGFISAWTLMLVYASFAGGIYAVTADEAQPAFGAVGLHLPWQAYAIIAFVLVMALAYLDIKISATVILALEGVSMLLVIIACSIVLAKGGFHGHAFSSAPFRPGGVTLPVLGLGIVLSFSTFSGFEQQPRSARNPGSHGG
jgi:hypothetical protein